MREFNRNMYPPGGYVFTEKDGSKLRGSSWRDLTKRVSHYREVNGIPMGDPEEDIEAQMCANHPGYCRENSPPPPPPAKVGGLTYNQRVLAWIAVLLGLKRLNKAPLVSHAEASCRAEICARCPFQRPLVQSCAPCIKSVAAGRKVLLEGKPSVNQGLQPCSLLSEDCQISVHLDRPASDNPDLPAHCWRKKQ